MKRFIFLFFGLLLMMHPVCRAQDFAPVGAIWHYTEGFAFEKIIDYLTIQSVKDTIIQGKPSKRLDCESICLYPGGKQYLHYSNDSLYRYNPDFNSFQLLAAFNAQKGGSWKFWLKDRGESTDTVTVKVDSVNMVTINQHPLRQLFVNYQIVNYNARGDSIRSFSYTSRIIEKLGDVHYLFNFPLTITMVCDGNFSEGLRCYEDAQFGFYSTGIAESCTYQHIWLDIKEDKITQNMDIFPNPTNGLIHVGMGEKNNLFVQIRDFSGKCLIWQKLNASGQVDLSGLANGLYYISVLTKNKRIGMGKVIKH